MHVDGFTLPPLRVLGQKVPDPDGVRYSQDRQFQHQSTREDCTHPQRAAGCSSPAAPGGATVCRIAATAILRAPVRVTCAKEAFVASASGLK